MFDFLVRAAGSVVIGWMLGAAAGLTVSRVFYPAARISCRYSSFRLRSLSCFWRRLRLCRVDCDEAVHPREQGPQTPHTSCFFVASMRG